MTSAILDATVLTATIPLGGTRPEGDLYLDPSEFRKKHFAEYDLESIADEWFAELESRPVSPHTLYHYRSAINSLLKSLRRRGKQTKLSALTATAIHEWRADLRAGVLPAKECGVWRTRQVKPSSEKTIQTYTITVKTLTKRYIRRRYTDHDLLELVEIGKLPHKPKQGMSKAERAAVTDAVDGNTFEAVRDRAFVQMLLATGLRFNEVFQMRLDRMDISERRVWVTVKGGRTEPVMIAPNAMRDLRVYLGRRKVVALPGEQLVWLKDNGKPMSVSGARAIFARIERRSGVHCNPHRFRHTIAQEAAKAGAPVADIQDLLHHKSDQISRLYIGDARRDVAAELSQRYSLAS